MKVVYIISRDFLSSLNFSLRIILIRPHALSVMYFMCLSYDVASGSEITPCNKIDKQLVVYNIRGTL